MPRKESRKVSLPTGPWPWRNGAILTRTQVGTRTLLPSQTWNLSMGSSAFSFPVRHQSRGDKTKSPSKRRVDGEPWQPLSQ